MDDADELRGGKTREAETNKTKKNDVMVPCIYAAREPYRQITFHTVATMCIGRLIVLDFFFSTLA